MDQSTIDTAASHDVDAQPSEQAIINQRVIDLLNSWDREDPEEQRETLEFLMQALDEDRTSTRKHFP